MSDPNRDDHDPARREVVTDHLAAKRMSFTLPLSELSVRA